MSGTLVLCATPIGNLEDITFRTVKALENACENHFRNSFE